ncbi:hypothetical protein R69619_03745 [Paraburkholderia nemoris]|uniref:hypothetical protein n=1 Tax=Paraburkholderia nemoris TaxID=2793076 RepID=UPI00190A4037|nr:hypothetical protein [Paraburkholderia nemoris]MBK3743157.1 hypothetical protein [Paraburkholderia aspalathi]CAE6768817.1 hypothetical protein R69619_03745 [Paraburkholderia nemoris]
MNADSEPVTSLPLAQGNYPFALSDDERRMTGDEWAWRFLRLNPCYRRDYELLQEQPVLLKELRRRNPSGWKEGAIFEEVKELDVRYFSLNASVLGPPCKWPNLEPLSLGTFLVSHPEIEPHHLAIRDFDSTRLYGISDWFDPSLPTLPELKHEQSWFFNLTEPIFSVGDNLFIGPKSSWEFSPRGNKVSVGYEGSVTRKEAGHFYGEIRKINDRGEVVVSFGRLADQPAQRIFAKYNDQGELIDSLDVKYQPPLKSGGFASRSEMVFAVSLDGYIQPQLRVNRDMAQHFQNILIENESLRVQPSAPVGQEPLIFRPDRAVATPFAKIQTDLASLAREPASAWQNWYIALIDVAYPLTIQFKAVEKLLLDQQQRLQEAGALAYSVRERAGRAGKGDFWLKRALCFVELQLNLPSERKNAQPGADRIARAIYDKNDTHHTRMWGKTGWERAPTAGAGVTEIFKEALRLGKDLAESQYAFLIGAAAADIARDS